MGSRTAPPRETTAIRAAAAIEREKNPASELVTCHLYNARWS